MVYYSLYLNKLTKDPFDYAARVVNAKTYGMDDIIRIATREGKTMTEEEMYGAYSSIEKAFIEIISEGGTINLSLFSTAFSISGVFNDSEENFTEGKHTLNLKAYPGDKLVEAARKNRIKRVKPNEYSPELIKVEDIASKTFNDLLSPGNMACLKGESIKFDPEQADEGLYLVNDRGQDTKAEQIARNMPSELVFLVPGKLAKGNYWMEVRNRSYQELSTGRLKHLLTVK